VSVDEIVGCRPRDAGPSEERPPATILACSAERGLQTRKMLSETRANVAQLFASLLCRFCDRAFVPPALPPNPPVDLLPLLGKLSAAERALGRLDGITVLLPSHELFIYMYVRKEAVLSSQIEGTQSTLTDLLRF
jgi:hypothetical protein